MATRGVEGVPYGGRGVAGKGFGQIVPHVKLMIKFIFIW